MTKKLDGSGSVRNNSIWILGISSRGKMDVCIVFFGNWLYWGRGGCRSRVSGVRRAGGAGLGKAREGGNANLRVSSPTVGVGVSGASFRHGTTRISGRGTDEAERSEPPTYFRSAASSRSASVVGCRLHEWLAVAVQLESCLKVLDCLGISSQFNRLFLPFDCFREITRRSMAGSKSIQE